MSQVSRGFQARGCLCLDDGGLEEAGLILGLDRGGGRVFPRARRWRREPRGWRSCGKGADGWEGRRGERLLTVGRTGAVGVLWGWGWGKARS